MLDPKRRLFGPEEPVPLFKEVVLARVLAETARVLPRPVAIDHYEIESILGQGGMGIVYAAHDEELDRRVAIKVLRVVDDRGRERMRREARALAKLSHPNVVHVHEFGVWQGHDYLVMELVEGTTLERWIETPPAGGEWRTRLSSMIQAGRGLAAAHAVDLVHRDFKPANVIVAADGRARVLDFGLARWVTSATPDELGATQRLGVLAGVVVGESNSGDPQRATTDTPGLTRSGAIVGTPDYMAPEQRMGAPASKQSDQYSFCLVLCEVLGVSPLEATGLPAWLRRALRRGLATDPAERWPSMDALLAELERKRHSRIGLGVGLVGIAAIAALALPRANADPIESCSLGSDAWSSQRRVDLRRAWAGSGLGHVAHSLGQIEGRLDEQRDAIASARETTCAARRASSAVEAGAKTDEGLAAREACLDQRERELEVIVDTLIEARPETIERGLEVVGGLGDVGICEQAELLGGWLPPKDRRVAEEVGMLRTKLAQADSLRRSARLQEAWALVHDVEDRAGVLDYDPLDAEVLLTRGRLQHAELDDRSAWTTLREAGILADRVGLHEVAASAWIDAVALGESDDPAASTEYLMAVAALERVAPPADLRWRILDWRLAQRLHGASRLSEALEAGDRALKDLPGGPAAELHRARTLRERGGVLHDLGRRDEALAAYEQSESLCRTLLDPIALECANHSYDLGSLMIEDPERRPEGLRRIEAAREVFIRVFPPDSGHLIMADLSVSNLAYMLGDFSTAKHFAERALALTPPGHPDRSYSLDVLASVELAIGDPERGEAAIEAAIAQHIAEGRTDDPRLAFIYYKRAGLRYAQGRGAEQIADLRLALAIYAKSEGGIDEARTWLALADTLLEDSRAPAEALAAYDRCDPILDAADAPELRRDQE